MQAVVVSTLLLLGACVAQPGMRPGSSFARPMGTGFQTGSGFFAQQGGRPGGQYGNYYPGQGSFGQNGMNGNGMMTNNGMFGQNGMNGMNQMYGSCTPRERQVVLNQCTRTFAQQHAMLQGTRFCQIQAVNCNAVQNLVNCLSSLKTTSVSNRCWVNLPLEISNSWRQNNIPCQFSDLFSSCQVQRPVFMNSDNGNMNGMNGVMNARPSYNGMVNANSWRTWWNTRGTPRMNMNTLNNMGTNGMTGTFVPGYTNGMMGANGMNTNGMMGTNGMNTNGMMGTNGMGTNGMNTNGMRGTNGMGTNGMNTNGMNTNGMMGTNGMNTNGMNTNGMMGTNGMGTNGMNTNGMMGTNGMGTNGMNTGMMGPNGRVYQPTWPNNGQGNMQGTQPGTWLGNLANTAANMANRLQAPVVPAALG